jgi:hypothetical protein
MSDDLFTPAKKSTPSSQVEAREVTVPSTLNYSPLLSTERWRVGQFDLLAAEFDLCAPWVDSMRVLHSVVVPHARQFLIVRRLFGVSPLAMPAATNPDDLRTWSRPELAENLGLDEAGLTVELTAIRALYLQKKPAPAIVTEAAPDPAAPPEELMMGEDLLERYGFNRAMFEEKWHEDGAWKARSAADNRREEEWFTRRVQDWKRMLDEPLAHTVARECLLDELQLKRLEVDVHQAHSGTTLHKDLQKLRAQVQASYGERLKQVQEMFPEMGVAGTVAFKAVISDVIQGYIKAKDSGNYALINRVCTAGELAVDLRQSEQSPVPQHRLGQTMYLIEAMNGLMDPNWRSKLNPRFLKTMDAIAKAATEAVRKDIGDVLTDLAKDGPDGEYPDDDPLKDEE